MSDLGTLGGSHSCAYAVNASGQVVGIADLPGDTDSHAFLYAGGTMHDLGTLGGPLSTARGINDAGDVVGHQGPPIASRGGFLYKGGVMKDLNGLLDADGAGYNVVEAVGIANNGMIGGYGTTPGGSRHALLLSPNAGVTGTVSLQDFAGDTTQAPVTIEVRNHGKTTVVQRQTVLLDAGGGYRFSTTLEGTYDVAVKAPHWLRRAIPSIAFTGTAFTGNVNFSLVNGDVNGDDAVDLADLVAIAAAWHSIPGSANWNPNADLNGDGSVDLADWLIAARNWRKSGDP
jgi:probable HAF family extracellular repeat protein